jgi:hypothetical protein
MKKMSEFENHKSRENPYRVPEGYFDARRRELLKIPEENRDKEVKVFRLSFGWIASGIAAALLVGLFLFGPDQPDTEEINLAFTDEEISNYVLSTYNYELNEELLLIELEAEDLSGIETEMISDEDLEIIIDENYDQTLHYEYL